MSKIPNRSDLPRALTALPNWVAWRTEVRPGTTKPTKVPYNLATAEKAASNNPDHWHEYPDPSEMPDGYDGVGFVFTKEAGITGIDLDACLDENENPMPWALPWLARFEATYYEISPSRTGIKIFAGGLLPGKGIKAYIDADGNLTDKRVSDAAIEMYDTGRYFAVTGIIAGPSTEVVGIQPSIDEGYKLLSNVRHAQPTGTASATGEPVIEGSRHNYLLGVAGKLRNEGFDRDALLVAIRQLNRQVCTPPKPDYEIVGIIDYVLAKPPKYRLTPEDFKAAATQTATGETFDLPKHQPLDEVTDDILTYTENLLAAAIESKDPQQILGVGVEPSELVQALAQAGSIKQHEARRRIKEAFGTQIPLGELDARIKAAEKANRPIESGSSPFILNAEGGFVPNVANAMTMLRDLPLQFNSFTYRAFLTAPAPWGARNDWTDHDDVKAAEWCQRKLLNIAPPTAAAGAEAVARERMPHYHPVVNYLRGLKWDGELRLDTWLVKYFGVADTPYARAVARKWMISGVARVMNPGVQADYTLVLEGDQGKRKSSALRLLGKDWFTDDIADIGTKDSAIQLQGKWIVEVAELDAFNRVEMTTVKAWLVRRDDNFRPPYGRRAQDFKRQNIFAASTNKSDWGNDDTGLRRFWPVVVGDIDIEGFAHVVDHLWAEATFAYNEGELHYLSASTEGLAKTEQHGRQHRDAWKDVVERWIAMPVGGSYSASLRSTPDRIFVDEVLRHGLSMAEKDWNNIHKARVTRILRLAGYVEKRATRKDADPDGSRPQYWAKKEIPYGEPTED